MFIAWLLFYSFLFGLPATMLFVAFRVPKKHWIVRDWYAGMSADKNWKNPGYEEMLGDITDTLKGTLP